MSIIMSKKVNGAINSIAFRISSANGVSSSPSSVRLVLGEVGNWLSRPVSFIILHCSSSDISGWLGGDLFAFFAFLRVMDAGGASATVLRSVDSTERK